MPIQLRGREERRQDRGQQSMSMIIFPHSSTWNYSARNQTKHFRFIPELFWGLGLCQNHAVLLLQGKNLIQIQTNLIGFLDQEVKLLGSKGQKRHFPLRSLRLPQLMVNSFIRVLSTRWQDRIGQDTSYLGFGLFIRPLMKTSIAILEVLDHCLFRTKMELSILGISFSNKLSNIYDSLVYLSSRWLYLS